MLLEVRFHVWLIVELSIKFFFVSLIVSIFLTIYYKIHIMEHEFVGTLILPLGELETCVAEMQSVKNQKKRNFHFDLLAFLKVCVCN